MAVLTVGTCQPVCRVLVFLGTVANSKNAPLYLTAYPELQLRICSWMEAEASARCTQDTWSGSLIVLTTLGFSSLYFSWKELFYFCLFCGVSSQRF